MAEARKASKQQYGMSAQTVKGHIRNAKAAFNWAHRFSLIPDNPFADFDGRPQATEPNQFVNLKAFEKAVRAAPTPGWRAMFGLCRLAGLRLEAARTLPWSGHATDSDGRRHRVGIDWDRRRVAEATYCAWLGHSPRVSREHYVAPTSDEYQAIIRAA